MNNVLSDFADAGITLLAQLNGIIEQLRTERDNLRKQIVEIDDKIVDIEKQHKVISDAVGITNYLPTPPEPGLNPTPERVTVKRASVKRTKRPADLPQQKLWIATKLIKSGQIKVGTLADEMAEVYPLSKERAIQNISAELSRLVRVDPHVTRTEPGVYKYTESEVNG